MRIKEATIGLSSGATVKMPLGTPASHTRRLGSSSGSVPDFSSLILHILLKELGACHWYERPESSSCSWLQPCLAPAAMDIWGVN